MSESGVKDLKKAPSVEEFVGELLSRIQPAPASEHRRRTVAQYVQDVIAQAFQPGVEASFIATSSWHCYRNAAALDLPVVVLDG